MEDYKEAKQLIKRIENLGLKDATIGDMVEEIERLRADKEHLIEIAKLMGYGSDIVENTHCDALLHSIQTLLESADRAMKEAGWK